MENNTYQKYRHSIYTGTDTQGNVIKYRECEMFYDRDRNVWFFFDEAENYVEVESLSLNISENIIISIVLMMFLINNTRTLGRYVNMEIMWSYILGE